MMKERITLFPELANMTPVKVKRMRIASKLEGEHQEIESIRMSPQVKRKHSPSKKLIGRKRESRHSLPKPSEEVLSKKSSPKSPNLGKNKWKEKQKTLKLNRELKPSNTDSGQNQQPLTKFFIRNKESNQDLSLKIPGAESIRSNLG